MKRADIHRIKDVERILELCSGMLCLYSGGLDGSWLLTQISTQKDKVTALHIDLGGNQLSNDAKALCRRLGITLIALDCRQRFAMDFVAPAIAAQARYIGGHPLSASLSRPLMAQIATELAAHKTCDAIVHTADRSQNSLRRFNGALRSLGFRGHYGSPFSISHVTREEKRRFLEDHHIPGFTDRLNSVDSNLWGTEYEAGDLDDPENISKQLGFRSSQEFVTKRLELRIEEGVPSVLNGETLQLHELLEKLTALISGTRIGHYIWLEELEGGEKVQEFHDMPAATVLLDAYRRLESASVSADCIREKMHVEQIWVREAAEGRWFEPLRSAAQAFIASIASKVSGTVCYDVTLDSLSVRSVRAEAPLYLRNRDELTDDGRTGLDR